MQRFKRSRTRGLLQTFPLGWRRGWDAGRTAAGGRSRCRRWAGAASRRGTPPRGTYAGAFLSQGSGAGTQERRAPRRGGRPGPLAPSTRSRSRGDCRRRLRPAPRPAPASRAASGAAGSLPAHPRAARAGPRSCALQGREAGGPSAPFPLPPCCLPSFGGLPDSATTKKAQIGKQTNKQKIGCQLLPGASFD